MKRIWFVVLVFVAGIDGAARATEVWLDVDVAAGLFQRDVDDAVALIQAFHSPSLVVRGVSAVYGNAPLDKGLPIAREVVQKFGPKGMEVFPGAAKARQLGEKTAAVEAMAASLREKPMTILALGPVTNVGSLVQLYPELHGRIDSIVMVAARRPGQRFTYPDAKGPSFRDFNFENDAPAMEAILATKIDLVFAPWEVSSHVWILEDDLDSLKASGGSGAWIAEKSESWITMWREVLGLPGFNPFDALGVAWVTHPRQIKRMEVGVWIEEGPDDTVSNGRGTMKPYLLVSPDAGKTRRAIYCYEPRKKMKKIILERLAGPSK